MARITRLAAHLAISRAISPATLPTTPHFPRHPGIFPCSFSPPPNHYPLSFLSSTILLPGRKGSVEAFTRLPRTGRPGPYLIRSFISGEEEGEGRRSKGRVEGYYH